MVLYDEKSLRLTVFFYLDRIFFVLGWLCVLERFFEIINWFNKVTRVFRVKKIDFWIKKKPYFFIPAVVGIYRIINDVSFANTDNFLSKNTVDDMSSTPLTLK
jgi:hypothetical protein